jgi:hypothetical protein
MITGDDIKDQGFEKVSLDQDQYRSVIEEASGMTKALLNKFLEIFDDRGQGLEASFIASLSVMDIGVKTMLFMSGGKEHVVMDILKSIVKNNLDDAELKDIIRQSEEMKGKKDG